MKKAIAIIILGLLWCNVGYTATVEWVEDIYINCEPTKYASEDQKKDLKYIKLSEIKAEHMWDAKEKRFLKNSEWIEVWEVKYILHLNAKHEEGSVWSYDDVEIDRETGILKFSHTRYKEGKKGLSLPDTLFQCSKITESDLPKIEVEQKF